MKIKMFWFLTALFFIILFLKSAYGDERFGQDVLGYMQPNFNESLALQNIQPNTNLGALDYSFGDFPRKLAALIDRVAPRNVRIHLLNTVCVRNNNCGSYEPVYRYSKSSLDAAIRRGDSKIRNFVQQRTTIYKGMAGSFPGTKFIISPALEHDLSVQAWRQLADWVLAVWPDVQLDNSPDGGVAVERYKGAWIERHGNSRISDGDIVSTDGVDVTDIDVDSLIKSAARAKIIFAWTRSYNGRTLDPHWVDPRARKAFPSAGTIELVSHIFDTRSAPQPFTGNSCRVIGQFKAPNILKPLAEDSANPDPRSNKPVLIASVNGFRSQNGTIVQALSANGGVVGKFSYYGPYAGSSSRYYTGWRGGSGDSGYQIEKNAVQASGSPWVWFQFGKQCVGPVIPGRRAGASR